MTINQTICQPKPCMKRDGNDRNVSQDTEPITCHHITLSILNLLWSFVPVLSFFPAFSFFSRFFSLTLFPTLFSTFSRLFSRLSVEGCCCRFSKRCVLIFSKTKYFSLLWDAKMASAFAVLLILTFALKTSTCVGVWLANYIPTLQEYTAGRDDLIESYYHRGLEYTEILLFLVFSHGISLSLRQLKRILKAKGLEEETPGCSSCGRTPQRKRLKHRIKGNNSTISKRLPACFWQRKCSGVIEYPWSWEGWAKSKA